MKFSCSRQQLCDAINCVSHAVSQKSTIAALEGIKLNISGGFLELTGYDMEIAIRTSIPVQSDDDGVLVVSARLFNEFVKRMDGDAILIEVDQNLQMNISSSATECSISAMSADEFPELPTLNQNRELKIKQSVLKSMIAQTTYAASTNENKPILTGALFDIYDGNFTMVAIDGFRLAIRNEIIDDSGSYKFVVPKKALTEVASLIKDDNPEDLCIICTDNKHIIFQINGFTVISRLLEGEFHNYKRSIPDSFKTEIILNTREFISCMERCSLLINDKNRAPVKCSFQNGEVRVNCKTAIGKVNDCFKADISGENVEIGFNNRYCLEALRAVDGDKVRVQLSGCNKVIKFLPLQGESFIYLLMPVQLK